MNEKPKIFKAVLIAVLCFVIFYVAYGLLVSLITNGGRAGKFITLCARVLALGISYSGTLMLTARMCGDNSRTFSLARLLTGIFLLMVVVLDVLTGILFTGSFSVAGDIVFGIAGLLTIISRHTD